MDYEVILSAPAKLQLNHIIDYILSEFGNEQAALSVLEDAENTRIRLSHVAGSLKLCDDSGLRKLLLSRPLICLNWFIVLVQNVIYYQGKHAAGCGNQPNHDCSDYAYSDYFPESFLLLFCHILPSHKIPPPWIPLICFIIK